MPAQNIRVELPQRPYTIRVEAGALSRLPSILLKHTPIRSQRLAIVSDRTVFDLYGASVRRDLGSMFSITAIILPPGETSKSFETLRKVISILAQDRFERSDLILALGGGVVGDIAGFVASIYKRGLPVIHCPTTLLAQIDSSIGGKTGVNHPLGKNLIGSFYQPSMVITDPKTLATLPNRELRSGLYEAIKYGCILSEPLFKTISKNITALLANDSPLLCRVISECCKLKAAVVAQDEREDGTRAILNFGHTAGHAVETVTRYRKFTHGEAVGFGMLVASRIAADMGLLDLRDARRIQKTVEAAGPLPKLDRSQVPLILRALQHDKKVKAGKVRFVLPREIGRVEIRDDVSESIVKSAIEAVIAGGV